MPDAPLKITYRSPTKLRAYERNARTHSEAQVRQIRASIDEFGFTNTQRRNTRSNLTPTD